MSQAVLDAARELATSTHGPTLSELCARAQVSRTACLHTVKNLVRGGLLRIPRTRKVEYRNRPVAEYEPAPPSSDDQFSDDALGRVMNQWVHR